MAGGVMAKLPGDYWFARPAWGFGPYPVTQQGWLVSLFALLGFFAIVITAFIIKAMVPDPSWLWLVILFFAFIDAGVTSALVRVKTDPVNRISDYRAPRSAP